MTSFSNSFIDNYIQRVTELSQSPQQIPSIAELEKLATDLGINPEEIVKAQEKSQAHLTRAQGYMRLKHWDEAIEELQEAITLSPSNEELLLNLANAHLERWRKHHHRDDAENVRLRVKECLFIEPNSEEALNLLAKLDKARQQRKTFWVGLAISFGSFLTISSLIWLYPESFNYSWSRLSNREAQLAQLEARLLAEMEALKKDQQNLRRELQSNQTIERVRYHKALAQLNQSLNRLKKTQQAWEYELRNQRFRGRSMDDMNRLE